MAKIRFGYSDDFTAKNSKVGINTTEPQTNLDVIGAVKGQDLKVTGISSQTGYEGFLRADHQIEENTQLNFGQGINASLSGEIIVGTGQTVTVNEVAKETVAVGNGSNNEWYSLSGSYTFKANGDPTWDESSFTYDGTGDYHQLNGSGSSSSAPESTFEVGSSNFTLEQWVYITSASSICGTFFSKGNNNSVGTEFMSLQTTGANTTPGFFFGSGSALLSGSSVGTGGWHHYVVTRSGNNFTLYVDGTSVDTATSSSSLAEGITGGINIGAQSYSVSTDGRKLNGKISITRLYSSRVLTAAEVTLNYNAGHTATTSAVAATVDLNANNPLSYPGTVNTVETTDVNVAGGSQVECMKVYNTFTPPSGGINDRPYKPKPGQLYYNYDFKTIEFHDGYGWRQVDYTTRSGRAVFGGGTVPSVTNTMEYVQISTFGNALDFGDLVGTTESPGGCSSSTRGLFSGGRNPGQLDRMDYITIASAGNAVDFGNLTDSGRLVYNAVSSSTRGVNLGGYKTSTSANTNVIDYVELSTLGDAQDFDDVTTSRRAGSAFSSPTRGIYGGGFSSVSESVIESLTIASKGNTVRFGELTFRGYGQGQGTCSSPVRGLFVGGNQDGSASGERSEISYITIASEGNATYFGDLAVARNTHGKASNLIRGVFAGGYTPTLLSSIETILISEGGSALDFGDLSAVRRGFPGVSDSHGGLGGF